MAIDKEKTLGIIGGMGPLATAEFYKLIARLTPADCDQAHFKTIIYSNPKIPKRVEFLLGESNENPVDELVKTARFLEDSGADMLAMPCVTAHAFYPAIATQISIPFMNMIDETVRYLSQRKIKTVGILASNGTLKCWHLQRALEAVGICAVLPSKEQQAHVTSVIYEQIKQNKPVQHEKLCTVAEELFSHGAEANLIACTDLSAYNQAFHLGEKNLDMMQILAQKTIEAMTSL